MRSEPPPAAMLQYSPFVSLRKEDPGSSGSSSLCFVVAWIVRRLLNMSSHGEVDALSASAPVPLPRPTSVGQVSLNVIAESYAAPLALKMRRVLDIIRLFILSSATLVKSPVHANVASVGTIRFHAEPPSWQFRPRFRHIVVQLMPPPSSPTFHPAFPCVGAAVGVDVGIDVGVLVGVAVVGVEVGDDVGDEVGLSVGTVEGACVGIWVGDVEGAEVGTAEEGADVGVSVGTCVGTADVGACVGACVGAVVGAEVGTCVGPVVGVDVEGAEDGAMVGVEVGAEEDARTIDVAKSMYMKKIPKIKRRGRVIGGVVLLSCRAAV